MSNMNFGIDLITFFDPQFWGVETADDVVELGRTQPRAFWDRILDSIATTGATGVELTFSPFGWEDTLAAYGSTINVQQAFDRRGLQIAAGFFADVAIGGELLSPERQAHYLGRAAAYADYLAALGVGVMVMGLPRRESPNADPPVFFDLAYASPVADFCNRLGAETLRRGVRLALHTEAHSIFSLPRDVDLMMLLTDPVYVGFCPDTAHLVLGGADPVAVVERHSDRLLIAHWKDATGAMPRDTPIDAEVHLRHRPYFCALGSGRVDWRRWIKFLKDDAFKGWAIVEIDAVADPCAAVRQSLAYVARNLEPIRSSQ